MITPREVRSGVSPAGDVFLLLDLDPVRTGMLVPVVIRMTPTEARRIAQQLVDKAVLAEGGSPPH